MVYRLKEIVLWYYKEYGDDNPIAYKIRNIENVSFSRKNNVMQIGFVTPDTTTQLNPEVYKMAAPLETIDIQFVITESDEDLSLGTSDVMIKDVRQQWLWLRKFVTSAIMDHNILDLKYFDEVDNSIIDRYLGYAVDVGMSPGDKAGKTWKAVLRYMVGCPRIAGFSNEDCRIMEPDL